uniref:Uncharacterized protein n=1 Tax=Glossina palpalis gambiensis TaxID=67801 RepID=A0A1B0B5S1_9MUSC
MQRPIISGRLKVIKNFGQSGSSVVGTQGLYISQLVAVFNLFLFGFQVYANKLETLEANIPHAIADLT